MAPSRGRRFEVTLTGKILGDDSTVIRLTRADCMSGLTRDEKGLVGSLGLGRPISLVIERSDLPAPVVRCLLASLYERGVITVVQPPTNASSRRLLTRPDRPPPRAAAIRLEPPCPQPAEDRDLATLDAETRREFRELEARMSSPDHFHVLNLPRTADPTAVKQRYYDLCRRLHPDRFTGAAASLSLRAERLFARLNEAQSTLCDPARRAQYLSRMPTLKLSDAPRTSVAMPAPQRAATPAPTPSSEERRERLRRHPFMRSQMQRVELIASGCAAFRQGDLVRALTDLEAAEKFGPLDPASARCLEDVRRRFPRKKT